MINKIDIEHFGSYRNFKWDQSIDKEFGSRNIIYGRNYSGKTTLSRIFRSIKQKTVHEDFKEGKFEITLDNGQFVSETQIEESDLNIRVYNSDFRDENLSILNDKDGNIIPFTIIGEKNIQVEKKIDIANNEKEEQEERLGNLKDKKGVLWDIEELSADIKRKDKSLTNTLSRKASEINRKTELFKSTKKKKQYNRNDLEKEIINAKSLSFHDREKYENIIKDQIKPMISINNNKNSEDNFIQYFREVDDLLTRDVKPSETISYLLEDHLLQQWVQEGIEFHRGIRETCAFCQSKLEVELWDKIDAHFTKESEEYMEKLKHLIDKVNYRITYWENDVLVSKEDFYSNFNEKYDEVCSKWEKIRSREIQNYKYLLEKLNQKQKDIFSMVSLDVGEIENVSEGIKDCANRYFNIVEQNNDYTEILDHEQEKARILLRQDEIKTFIKDIDYTEQKAEIITLNKNKSSLEEKKEVFKKKIDELKKNISQLESEINDEERAVRQVNIYLKSFLGHPELSLELEKNNYEKKSIFVIKRNNKLAYNLSEGEKSLIAFCYFLSSLKDISNPEDYIIFVDDPISSLDANNIFYTFSLIDIEIARKSYKQLFISTHNLDLLKYLQRIEKPTNNKQWKNKFFIIEGRKNKKSETSSYLLEMPEYLKKYATEFIYLFHQITKVALEEQNDSNFHCFYSFPNAARKFLESYLYFRYPDHTLHNDKRLERFFNNDLEHVSFLNRINNEFSHGENKFDRLENPIDIPEFKKDAQLILKTIATKDEEQLESLCNSIGLDSDKILDISFNYI